MWACAMCEVSMMYEVYALCAMCELRIHTVLRGARQHVGEMQTSARMQHGLRHEHIYYAARLE